MKNYELAKLLEIAHRDSNESDHVKQNAYLELARRHLSERDEEVKEAINESLLWRMHSTLFHTLFTIRANYVASSEENLHEGLKENKILLEQLLSDHELKKIKKLEERIKNMSDYVNPFDD